MEQLHMIITKLKWIKKLKKQLHMITSNVGNYIRFIILLLAIIVSLFDGVVIFSILMFVHWEGHVHRQNPSVYSII